MEIYRLELAFFNPAENRWQLFQEDSYEQPEEREEKEENFELLFCSVAQNTLKSLRKSIQSIADIKKSGANIKLMPGIEKDNQKPLEISGAEIWKRLLDVVQNETVPPNQKIDNVHHASLIQEGEVVQNTSLNPEGDVANNETVSPNTKSNDDLLHLILNGIERKHMKIAKYQKVTDDLAKKLFHAIRRKESVKYDKKQVRKLISTLFIARDWDVYGRISFPHALDPKSTFSGATIREMDVEIQFMDLKNPDQSPNPIKTSFCGRPQNSVFEDYLKKMECEDPSGLHRDLDYQVSLDLCDLTQRDSKETVLYGEKGATIPYFHFCTIPKKEERIWYIFYAHLYDLFQTFLSPTPEERQIRMRVLPLRICGYDHFFHIYYIGKSAPLWQNSQVGILKECLRELLVQMHVSAFQYYSSRDLRRIENLDQNARRQIFCKHAPNLVRMNWAEFEKDSHNTKQIYIYTGGARKNLFVKWRLMKADELEKLADSSNLNIKGRQNYNSAFLDDQESPLNYGEGNPHIAKIDRGKVKIYVPWENLDGFKTLVGFFQGTGEERLREQWIWLDKKAKSIEHLRRIFPDI